MSFYQIRTLPGGRTYGLYEIDSQKWVSPSGKTDAITPHGAYVFATTVEAFKYRDRRNFDYSRKHINDVADAAYAREAAQAIADGDVKYFGNSDDELLEILRKRDAAMDEMFSPEYQKSVFKREDEDPGFTGVTKDSISLAEWAKSTDKKPLNSGLDHYDSMYHE